MIPIIYENTERDFTTNGLGRLRDCISCIVTEERNGIYECNFEYPIDGANYDLIQIGRIIGVTHDDSGDIQPFDIVSYSKPIDGIVEFHAVHISYRQSYIVVNGTEYVYIGSLASALTLLKNSTVPTNPFNYSTDKTSTGWLPVIDGSGVPYSVRAILGGTEGSILDTYGGEFEWDRWNVILHSSRGQRRDFTIRYGVNLLDYDEELDTQGTYSSCIPYWTDGNTAVVGDKQSTGSTTASGRDDCVPLDVSDKFENKPTKAQVNAKGLSVMNSLNPTAPAQNITIEFVRLQDMGYEGLENLLTCRLCDSINVVFPDYHSTRVFKIVKVEWNVLEGRYESMELGDLSITLSEALGIDNSQLNETLSVDSPTPSITTITGTLVSSSARQYGNVVQLVVTVRNSSAVASAGNVFKGTLNNLTPAVYATGASYYDGHCINGAISSGTITIRNASSSSVTISGNNSVTVSFVYIV